MQNNRRGAKKCPTRGQAPQGVLSASSLLLNNKDRVSSESGVDPKVC